MIIKIVSGLVLFLWVSAAAAADKTLLVGTTGDYGPMSLFNEETGEFEGTSIDLVEEFARDRGYEIEYVRTTWFGLIPGLVSGAFQMAVGGISRTPERATVSLPSVPLGYTGKVAMVRCGEEHLYSELAKIDQLGTRVVVYRGTTTEDFALYTIRNAELIIIPDTRLVNQYVAENRADVLLTETPAIPRIKAERSELCAVAPDRPFTNEEMLFLFNRGEGPLRDEFNEWFLNR